MHHIQGCDRDQTLLLPNSVADYISPDNAVRFVEAFVDQLDLQEAGFCRVEPKETGRPGYDPAEFTKALHVWLFEPRTLQPTIGSGD